MEKKCINCNHAACVECKSYSYFTPKNSKGIETNEYRQLKQENEELSLQIRDLVREIEIDRDTLEKLECKCCHEEHEEYTCERCSRIWELNALLKGLELAKAKGVE